MWEEKKTYAQAKTINDHMYGICLKYYVWKFNIVIRKKKNLRKQNRIPMNCT
jgi:hypothetical protein